MTYNNIPTVVFSFFNYFFQYVKERSKLNAQGLMLKAFYRFLPSALRFRLNVENNGFEPLTPCVQGRCSSQLS